MMRVRWHIEVQNFFGLPKTVGPSLHNDVVMRQLLAYYILQEASVMC